MKYDSIIIGAGLSGLAAGIRLSHFDKKVLILESHSIAGGMNSYFIRQGRSIDVGLHAMTNFSPAGARNTPLTKLLRQLRIKHTDLGLVEQGFSEISFPNKNLKFSNDVNQFRSEVLKKFPSEIDGFDKLRDQLNNFDSTAFLNEPESALTKLGQFIKDRELIDMILCPVMFYGNAMENDMNWAEFAVMWDSIFESGFSRPKNGMSYIINLLTNKYTENGGELKFNKKVAHISKLPSKELEVTLEDGSKFISDQVYSSARLVETSALCGIDKSEAIGKICFSELVLYLDKNPKELGCEQSIIFYSLRKEFEYCQAQELIDPTSGVICMPNNFEYPEELGEGIVRLSIRSSYNKWQELTKKEYKQAKIVCTDKLIGILENYMPNIRAHIKFDDMFTPLTITRYTGHIGGSIYGSATKIRDAALEMEGVYLIGTDQGFLGIIGSLLSGISVVNRYGLK